MTCVAYTPDGKVVSGGMDSKLWLWQPSSTRGVQMEGHAGPISQVGKSLVRFVLCWGMGRGWFSQ